MGNDNETESNDSSYETPNNKKKIKFEPYDNNE
jgi:hypothetical protein